MFTITLGRRNASGRFQFSQLNLADGTTWNDMIEDLRLTAAEAGEVYYNSAPDPHIARSPATGEERPGDGTVYTFVPTGVAMSNPVAGAVLLLNPPGDDPLVVQPHPGGRYDARAIDKVISGVNVIGAPGRVGSYFLSLQDVVLVGTALAEFALKPGAFAGGTVTIENPSAAIDLADIALPVGKSAAGWAEWTISATDGTDIYAGSFVGQFVAVNSDGTISSDVKEDDAYSLTVSSGAHNVLVVGELTSGENKVTFSVVPQSEVGAPALTSITVAFRIYDRLGNTLSPLAHGETPEFVEE